MPCLRNSPERKSNSKAPKRAPRVREVTAIRRFRVSGSLPLKTRRKEYRPDHARGRCNLPEFKELDDQNKNTHRPSADHCAFSDFAPMFRVAGPAFCTTTEHAGGSMQNSRTLGGSNSFMNPRFHRIAMALTIAAALLSLSSCGTNYGNNGGG